jgi:hypothetical protein
MIMSYLLLQLVILPVTMESASMPPALLHYVIGPFESVFPKSLLCHAICSREVEPELTIL